MMLAVWLAACSTDSATGADASSAEASDQEADPATGPAVSGPAVDASGAALGQLKATEHINLAALINKTPAEVDATLGEPTDTGSDRVSCVRFVPERVFFACEQTIHVYAHEQFEQIRVEFEDGRSGLVAVSGLPGEGAFDHNAALASVGVSLPGQPRHSNPSMGMGGEPGDVVDLWVWGNSSARLLVDELEHRVQLSVVNGDWRRSKLEVIINHPLTDAQKAKIKLPRGAETSTPVPPAPAPAQPGDASH